MQLNGIDDKMKFDCPYILVGQLIIRWVEPWDYNLPFVHGIKPSEVVSQ